MKSLVALEEGIEAYRLRHTTNFEYAENVNARTLSNANTNFVRLFCQSSAVAEMGDHARAKCAEKWVGGAVPLSVGSCVSSHLTRCRLG